MKENAFIMQRIETLEKGNSSITKENAFLLKENAFIMKRIENLEPSEQMISMNVIFELWKKWQREDIFNG